MRTKERASESTSTPFPFRSSNMDYVQVVNGIVLDTVRLL